MMAFDVRTRRLLLADWFTSAANDAGLQFDQQGRNEDTFTFGSPNSFHVVSTPIEGAPFLRFVASDPTRQNEVDDVAAEALKRFHADPFGRGAWYSTELEEYDFPWHLHSVVSRLMQRVGSQARIAGWRRLGSDVLLEFAERARPQSAGAGMLAPLARVKVHVHAPGPCQGHFASEVAHATVETVGAICTFALGRPVQLPPAVFPASPDSLLDLDNRRPDPAIGTLARKKVSLDILSFAGADTTLDVFRRARAALITFDAAAKQEHDLVAIVLYVAACESLTTPNQPWRLTRLTKRFVDFFDELMPTALDGIVAHGNFEDVFRIRRQGRAPSSLRRELLKHLYAFRSGQLHEGLRPFYMPSIIGTSPLREMRRGLVADVAEAAVIDFFSAPRSSLIGHPSFANAAHPRPDARTNVARETRR